MTVRRRSGSLPARVAAESNAAGTCSRTPEASSTSNTSRGCTCAVSSTNRGGAFEALRSATSRRNRARHHISVLYFTPAPAANSRALRSLVRGGANVSDAIRRTDTQQRPPRRLQRGVRRGGIICARPRQGVRNGLLSRGALVAGASVRRRAPNCREAPTRTHAERVPDTAAVREVRVDSTQVELKTNKSWRNFAYFQVAVGAGSTDADGAAGPRPNVFARVRCPTVSGNTGKRLGARLLHRRRDGKSDIPVVSASWLDADELVAREHRRVCSDEE